MARARDAATHTVAAHSIASRRDFDPNFHGDINGLRADYAVVGFLIFSNSGSFEVNVTDMSPRRNIK